MSDSVTDFPEVAQVPRRVGTKAKTESQPSSKQAKQAKQAKSTIAEGEAGLAAPPAVNADAECQFIRAIVLTAHDIETRPKVLATIDALSRLLDPIGKAPLVVVASIATLQIIGSKSPALRTGTFQHIELPVDEAAISVVAAAKRITALVRAMPDLNPTGNPKLKVHTAFAYTGYRDSGIFDSNLILPETSFANGRYFYPYPMLNYAYAKSDPRPSESLSDFALSLAYINYTTPVQVAPVKVASVKVEVALVAPQVIVEREEDLDRSPIR